VRTDALPGPEDFRALALDLGRQIVDQLCAAGPRPASLYLNDGASGALLAVTEMVRRETGAAGHHALREAAAALLHRADEPSGLRQLHGLYVGEAGIAAALLRAGLVLEDATLVNGAAQRASAQFGQPHTSPDVFHGTAGRVWLALRLWEVTAQPVFLSHATEGADWLLAQMDRDGRGRTGTWTIPAGYDGLSGQAFFGFAHGCAGIGAVMTEMFAETGAARFRAAAALVARRLRREAKHSGAAGATWPTSDCDPSRPGPFWCHGSAGIGEFFLRYGQATRDPTAMRIAQDCARAVIACSRWIGHTQCHGLSGSIEFLIDCHQAWRSRPPLRHARKLGAILLDHRGALEAAIAAGELGYMSGASGAVGALLRLAAPTPAMRITGAGFLPGAAA
jgi:lantibiotic modifying enzyme